MKPLTLSEKIDSFLSELELVEPISFDLGTPSLPEVDTVYQLVTMGQEIVPYLLECIQSDVSKKGLAYIVLVLNHIGDIRALVPLVNLRVHYQQREEKDEWDYAVIGQCSLAIKRLKKNIPAG